jgi:hypothetical protein
LSQNKKGEKIMKINRLFIAFVLIGVLMLSSCDAAARVGELRTESQSVELGDAKSVSVDVEFGSGVLTLPWWKIYWMLTSPITSPS